MSYPTQDLIDKIHPTNETIFEVWIHVLTNPTFLAAFTLFFGFLLTIWGIGFMAGVRDVEFIGYMNSLVHAILNTVIAILIIANYTNRDILELHVDRWNNPRYQEPMVCVHLSDL